MSEAGNNARISWLRNMCPCCCSPLVSWTAEDGTEYDSAPIAEGVIACGRCWGNNHFDDSEAGRATLEMILRDIANG